MQTGRREHISPVLQELHWQPVRRQSGNTDVSVATRLHTVVSLRRVQVSASGQSPSPLVWRHHMSHIVIQNLSGRQVV